MSAERASIPLPVCPDCLHHDPAWTHWQDFPDGCEPYRQHHELYADGAELFYFSCPHDPRLERWDEHIMEATASEGYYCAHCGRDPMDAVTRDLLDRIRLLELFWNYSPEQDRVRDKRDVPRIADTLVLINDAHRAAMVALMEGQDPGLVSAIETHNADVRGRKPDAT